MVTQIFELQRSVMIGRIIEIVTRHLKQFAIMIFKVIKTKTSRSSKLLKQ